MEIKNPYISIVIPAYNCSACLQELYDRLVYSLNFICNDNFEIIMVNDASPQNDWDIIVELANKDSRVKGLNLSRNFGQHFAITAGLDYTSGDWVIVMDGDLQDRPEEIPKLYSKAQEGFDVVFGRRYDRQDNKGKKLTSKLFHRFLDYLGDMDTDETVANYSICSHKVINNFRAIREHNRSYPEFIRWMGYKVAYVDIEHAQRPNGKSSYSLKKKVELATQVIVANSNKPLRLSIGLGTIIAIIALVYGLWLVIRYYFLAQPPQGWTSVIVSIYFIGGLLFANLGVLGLYIGKIFDETKNRPLYIISDTTYNPYINGSTMEADDGRTN